MERLSQSIRAVLFVLVVTNIGASGVIVLNALLGHANTVWPFWFISLFSTIGILACVASYGMMRLFANGTKVSPAVPDQP